MSIEQTCRESLLMSLPGFSSEGTGSRSQVPAKRRASRLAGQEALPRAPLTPPPRPQQRPQQTAPRQCRRLAGHRPPVRAATGWGRQRHARVRQWREAWAPLSPPAPEQLLQVRIIYATCVTAGAGGCTWSHQRLVRTSGRMVCVMCGPASTTASTACRAHAVRRRYRARAPARPRATAGPGGRAAIHRPQHG